MSPSLSTTKNTLWEEKNLTKPKNNCLNNNVSEQKDIIKDTNDDSTKNPCNDTGKISGIYKIVNKINGKYYVGSSNDIKRRWRSHQSYLNNNKHPNSHLQNSWNKYGKHAFEFIVLENTNELIIREQCYLNIAKKEQYKSYNVWFNVTCKDNKQVSETTKEKIKNSHLLKYKNGYIAPMTGKKHSAVFKKKRSELYTGSNNPNYGNKKIAGKNHFKYDTKIYSFYNKTLNIFENMTMYDFYTKYKLSQSGTCRLIHKKIKSQKGWIII